MGGVGVLIIFLVILWLLAFMTKRRFGILGLALTAGAYLSSLWSRDMVTLLDSLGLSFATLSTAGFVAIAIVLLPAFLLLFSGQSSKAEDIELNVCKKKHLTNTRSSSADEALTLVPPRKLSLEQALDFIDTDEILEVTPESLRIRKRILDPTMRKRASIAKKNAMK
jgi:hypothetical protein